MVWTSVRYQGSRLWNQLDIKYGNIKLKGWQPHCTCTTCDVYFKRNFNFCLKLMDGILCLKSMEYILQEFILRYYLIECIFQWVNLLECILCLKLMESPKSKKLYVHLSIKTWQPTITSNRAGSAPRFPSEPCPQRALRYLSLGSRQASAPRFRQVPAPSCPSDPFPQVPLRLLPPDSVRSLPLDALRCQPPDSLRPLPPDSVRSLPLDAPQIPAARFPSDMCPQIPSVPPGVP